MELCLPLESFSGSQAPCRAVCGTCRCFQKMHGGVISPSFGAFPHRVWIMEKAREFQKNIYFCFIDCAKAFDCVDHNKLWKILKEMGIPDHLTCRLRKGTPLASRVAQGVSGPLSSCVWNLQVFADDARGWQCPFVLCLHPQGCLRRGVRAPRQRSCRNGKPLACYWRAAPTHRN